MTEPKLGPNRGNAGKGRPKGSPNKKTAELQAAVAAAGETPLDFLLRIMRDDNAEEARRIDCAKAAAMYVHPKLSSIDMQAKIGALTDEDRRWLGDGS